MGKNGSAQDLSGKIGLDRLQCDIPYGIYFSFYG